MLLVIGGIKGGSGKTTLATNLCQMRSDEGRRVLLVDADEQKSSYDWYQQRQDSTVETKFTSICLNGKGVRPSLKQMLNDYDDIVVDTGGRDTNSQRAAISLADKLLIPFKPSSIDIWTVGAVKAVIDGCAPENLKSYFIINQADAKGRDNQDALDILKGYEDIECLPFFVGNRKSFRNAAAEGLGIKELIPRDEKACAEMFSLYSVMYQE